MTESPHLEIHDGHVLPEWIDFNGHMNVAFYVLAFEEATEALAAHVGLSPDRMEAAGTTLAVVEGHVTYDQEVMEGDPLRFTTLVAGVDAHRLHVFHEMFQNRDHFLSSTNELLLAHISLESGEPVPFPDDVKAALEEIAHQHAALPRPDKMGRVVGIRRKPAAAAGGGA